MNAAFQIARKVRLWNNRMDTEEAHTATDATTVTTGAVVASGAITAASADIAGNIEFGGCLTDGGLVAASAAIPVTMSAAYEIITAAAETNTIAAPTYCGQIITLYMRTRAVGDRVVAVTGATVNQTGNNRLTFGADGDFIALIAIDVNGTKTWRILANDGVALSTV